MRDAAKSHGRIGGSEVSAIFGGNPYLDEFGLWAKKKGGLPEDPPTDRMLLGYHLQRGVAEYWGALEKVEVQWLDVTSAHETYPFMSFTPDALVVGERRGLDVKLAGWDQSWRWGRDADHIPDHAIFQAWWYMAALDYDRWDVVVLIAGEDRPRSYPVYRSARIEQKILLPKARAWWERYLVGDERPPITDSEPCSRWIKRTYPEHRKNTLAQATDKEAELLDAYAKIRVRHKRAESEKVRAENELRDLLGEREGLVWAGGKFTWRKSRDSQITDWPALAERLLDLEPEKDRLIAEFSVTKTGSRRIYFKANGSEEEEL